MYKKEWSQGLAQTQSELAFMLGFNRMGQIIQVRQLQTL